MRFAALFAILLSCTPALAFETLPPKAVSTEVEGGRMVLVDIRTPEEWAETGVAKGATPLDMTSANFQNDFAMLFGANPGKKIALICRSGNRSSQLAGMMESSGLTNIVDVEGGTAAWIADGLPVAKP